MGECRLEQCTVKKIMTFNFFNFHGMVNRGVTFVLLSVDRYYICLRTVACEWENLERSMLTEACQWDGATRRVRKGVITFLLSVYRLHISMGMESCRWENGDGSMWN